ncbi:mechanosensitive ion channel family protein [Paraburkholderia sp. DHOC27]|uniref:mechanosensitive ion channel family protein n=1 Tax=Paraburkholderia sp. DHOC27 TaxID=2303330 RepID=UPI000E3DBE7A|nr:mechanosensitive ion channel family protein [Paraburkholderia sp. DHOC27]RFU49678.1 mechanosensitive ion channel protein MscS [Paraburkholderia sp. DHOC27]
MNNPLIYGFAIVAIDAVVWSRTMPRNESVRLLLRLCLYAALSVVLFASGLSPFSQAPYADSRTLHTLGQVLEIIWWLTGARLLSMVLDTLLLPKTWRRQRLFEDVFGALAFLAAIVASLGFVLELPVRGLVATSGALAIVLGLAIQSTLSDVFAGIVINTTEPYQVGDSVSIDGTDGKVLEMNWRATILLSGQGNIVIVPNAVAAKAKITNSSRPTALHGVSITLEVSPEARPGVVLEALNRALKGVRAVLPDPAPYALVKSAGTQSLQYEATAYVDDIGKKLAVTNELYDLSYRHLEAAGVRLRPLGTLSAAQDNPVAAADDARVRILRRVDLFAGLSPDELAQLAPHLTRHGFEAGEVLVMPEVVSDSLSIVDSGVLSAVAQEASGPVEIGRLGPGESIGEAGLLAGLPARVKVSALTDVVIYRLKKDDLTPILKRNPEIATMMCQLVSRRQKTLDKIGAPTPVAHSEESLFDWLLDGVRKLHGLTL